MARIGKDLVQCFPAGKTEKGMRSFNCYEQGSKCKSVKEKIIAKCASAIFKDVQGLRVNGIVKDVSKMSVKVDKNSCTEQSLGSNKVVNCKIVA